MTSIADTFSTNEDDMYNYINKIADTAGKFMNGVAQAGVAQAGVAQAGDAQAGDAQAGDAQAGDAQAGDAQAGVASTDKVVLVGKGYRHRRLNQQTAKRPRRYSRIKKRRTRCRPKKRRA